MRIHFATSPGLPGKPQFASLIPDDVRRDCDVGDVLWSTNATRDPAGREDAAAWIRAARKADELNLPFVADLELGNFRTKIDVFKPEPAKFAANLEECKWALGVVRTNCPDVRMGAYPALPAGLGLLPGQYTPEDRVAQLAAEREVIRPLVDFYVVEAALQDLGKPMASLAEWERDLDRDVADCPDQLTERYILIGDCYTNGKKVDQYPGDHVYAAMIQEAAKRGKVMVWNARYGWPVIRQLAGKN